MLVVSGSPKAAAVFRPPSAMAYLKRTEPFSSEHCVVLYVVKKCVGRGLYHQRSPSQSPETGCVGRCLQTAFFVRMKERQHLHALEPR